jgi:hypothetical protein
VSLALSRLDVSDGHPSREASPGGIVVEEEQAHSATPRPAASGAEVAVQSGAEVAPPVAPPAGESGPGAATQNGAETDAASTTPHAGGSNPEVVVYGGAETDVQMTDA